MLRLHCIPHNSVMTAKACPRKKAQLSFFSGTANNPVVSVFDGWNDPHSFGLKLRLRLDVSVLLMQLWEVGTPSFFLTRCICMSPSSAGEEEGARKCSATVTQTEERCFSVQTPQNGYSVNMSLLWVDVIMVQKFICGFVSQAQFSSLIKES